jgi:hypothetical protein
MVFVIFRTVICFLAKTSCAEMKKIDLTLPYLIFLIFCCSAFCLKSQSSFIETLQESTFLQGNAKRWIYDSLKTDSRYVNVTPIRVKDLWSFQTGGTLIFSLPHVQFTLNIRATAPRRYTSTRYSWAGTIVNQYNQPIGRAVFFQEGDKYFGTIDLPNRKLVIQDLNAGVPDDQVLVEFDQTNPPNEICGTDSFLSPPGGPTGGPEGGPPPPPPPLDTCQAVVAVLFLYTQRVLDVGRDPDQIATMAVQALNETLGQSASSHTDVRVVIAGLDTLTSFDDYANEAADCEETINTFMPRDSTTQALRNQYRADIVVLLQETDIFYINNGSINYGVVGIANINEEFDSNRVYSTVEAGSAGVTKTIVHEIGHLFGCRHRGGGHSFANGFQLCINPNTFGGCQGNVNTIMNPSANDNTIYRFSNADPSVLYETVPIGADTADNMSMINRTACNISEFRIPLFYPFISGPTNVSHNIGIDYDYSPLYQNCIDPQGPSSYTWEVSWDYGNTYSFLSFDEDAVLEGENVPTHAPWGIILRQP